MKASTLIVPLLALAAVAPAALAGELPPAEADGLYAFLKSGEYKSWARESAPHPSRGPHPVRVIAYFNPTLEASMKRGGKQEHPRGAAVVKELYDGDGRLSGWAAAIKTDARSAVGKGWYWYEVLSVAQGERPVAADKGVPLCYGCHAPGRDFILTEYPLR